MSGFSNVFCWMIWGKVSFFPPINPVKEIKFSYWEIWLTLSVLYEENLCFMHLKKTDFKHC